MLMWIFILSFLCGLLSFSLNRKHLLLMLLSLEFMIISLFIMMFFSFSFNFSELYFCFIFMTMSVCESALGLSVLVSLIRTHGNDYMSTFNILW